MNNLEVDRMHSLFKQNNQFNVGDFQDFESIQTIYHYTSIESLKSIISNKSFWISNCHFLNDSQEMLYTIKLVKEIYTIVAKNVWNKGIDFIIAKPKASSLYMII